MITRMITRHSGGGDGTALSREAGGTARLTRIITRTITRVTTRIITRTITWTARALAPLGPPRPCGAPAVPGAAVPPSSSAAARGAVRGDNLRALDGLLPAPRAAGLRCVVTLAVARCRAYYAPRLDSRRATGTLKSSCSIGEGVLGGDAVEDVARTPVLAPPDPTNHPPSPPLPHPSTPNKPTLHSSPPSPPPNVFFHCVLSPRSRISKGQAPLGRCPSNKLLQAYSTINQITSLSSLKEGSPPSWRGCQLLSHPSLAKKRTLANGPHSLSYCGLSRLG